MAMLKVTDSPTASESLARAFARWKVAIVHPTSWPQVRRGTERFMNEWAAFLVGRGHNPKIVCSKPGRGESHFDGGFVTDYHRSIWYPWMQRLGIHPFHLFPITTFSTLVRERFDVVHCFNFTDAYAASAVRRFTGARVLLHLSAIPPPSGYRRSLSTGGAIFRRAAAAADALLTHSEFQADYFERLLGRRPIVITAPVDTDRFRPQAKDKTDRPLLVNASALDERRKGGRFLMRAFNSLKRRIPRAELRLCGPVSEGLRRELLAMVSSEWRTDVVFENANGQELPRLYAAASLSVLPSVWEACPLVVLESLASGTPVVGTRHGGIPELVTSAVGRTFDPGPLEMAEPTNVEAFVEAVVETLGIAELPETPSRCRRAAERFGWVTLGPQYEAVYHRLLASREFVGPRQVAES